MSENKENNWNIKSFAIHLEGKNGGRTFNVEPSAIKPFDVNIFSPKRRFSTPAIVICFRFFYRWSVYVFVPFLIFFACCFGTWHFIVTGGIDVWQTIGLIFVGSIVPLLFLIGWYWKAPYWYLNGCDSGWRIVRMFCEDNGHKFPETFHDPLILDEFEQSNKYLTFGLEKSENSLEINGFVVSDVNITWKEPAFIFGEKYDKMGFYLETTYWKPEADGLHFYGERMNIFVPYSAIHQITQGWLYCNIIIKLNVEMTCLPVERQFDSLCISIGHSRTLIADLRLRNELFERIRAAKLFDLMQKMSGVRSAIENLPNENH